MLRPVVTKTIENFSSVLIGIALISLAGIFFSAIVANVVAGKSPQARQGVFYFFSFMTLCIAVYYAKSKLGGSA